MGSLLTGQIVTVPGLQWTVSLDESSAGSGPLFWIYLDKEGRWCLRKEGDETDAFFESRADALTFIRNVEGNTAYRLFIETDSGKVVLEQHAALSPRPESGPRTTRQIRCRRPARLPLRKPGRRTSATGWHGHISSNPLPAPVRPA